MAKSKTKFVCLECGYESVKWLGRCTECGGPTKWDENKGRYGYRRVYAIMRNNGYYINHKTVQKLMKELGLKGKQRKNDKYHSYKGTVGKVADNVLNRNFNSSKDS